MNIFRCLSAPDFFANESTVRLFFSTMGNNCKAGFAFIPGSSSSPVTSVSLLPHPLSFHSPALKPALTKT